MAGRHALSLQSAHPYKHVWLSSGISGRNNGGGGVMGAERAVVGVALFPAADQSPSSVPRLLWDLCFAQFKCSFNHPPHPSSVRGRWRNVSCRWKLSGPVWLGLQSWPLPPVILPG